MTWNNGKSYSDSDMLRMQQDAIRRVKEMQLRADQTLQDANQNYTPPVIPSIHTNESRPAPQPSYQGTGSHHNQSASNAHGTAGTSNNNSSSSINKTIDHMLDSGGSLVSSVLSYFTGAGAESGEELSPIASILQTLHLDSERLIVLGMLIVLMNEKADKTMLLALFYLLF